MGTLHPRYHGAVSVKLFDSKAHELVEFLPLIPGHVSLYVCGPTVQSSPHVGHLRSALVYDLWARWFEYRGFHVTVVRNVTDIDDKILEASSGSGEEWWALAERVEAEFQDAADSLGISRPTKQPRATGDIPSMLELISTLLASGHAYSASDGSGDVYFDVSKWSDYGELTHQKVEDLRSGTGHGSSEAGAKSNPEDFALWKGHKASEPATASWSAPWGAGRPGWHLECTAMATRYLGSSFDIHGGGMDLRFPHHENELAQARAAGHGYAHHWLHNALVTVTGQKMSKSLGNGVLASEMLVQARPIVIRYALASAHYRSELDLHEGFLAEAGTAFGRIESFLARAETQGVSAVGGTVPEAFAQAMDDDLGIPAALAVLHDTVRKGNHAADENESDAFATAAKQVRAMLAVLGLDPLDSHWGNDQGSDDVLEALVENVLALRGRAKSEKDFGLSDALRAALDQSGIDVQDEPTNSTWSIRG